jgi:hypothetical protein
MAEPTYMLSAKNVASIFKAIQEAGVPDRFTHEFLKQLGFTSSADRGVIRVMKSMRFLDDSSAPTDRYKRYRDASISATVMAEALRDAYGDLFKINENAQTMSSPALKGAFKRISGKGDSVTEKMAGTFKALAGLADWSTPAARPEPVEPDSTLLPQAGPAQSSVPVQSDIAVQGSDRHFTPALRHDIHVHLPVADIKVYDAIFRSLRENFG